MRLSTGQVRHSRSWGFGFLSALAAEALGDCQQALGPVRAAVEDDILAGLAQFRFDRLVDRELARVDDPHVHARLDGVIEEYRMHRLAHRLVAAEREREVGDAPRDMRMGQRLTDLPRGLDEGDAIAVVLLDAGRDGEDVGVEDDVLGRKIGLLGQQLVGARADRDLALERVGLALFVERHHHHRRAIGAHEASLAQELLLAFLHRDRIDDRLALDAFEPGLDHREFRRIDHHRHARDVRLGSDEVEELDHHRLRIDEPLVHVDVDDLRAIRDLIAGDDERARIVARGDELAELGRAGDIGALPDVDERNVGGERERLEAREPHQGRDGRRGARLMLVDRLGDGADVVRRRAAASSHYVDNAIGGELADLRRHRLRALVILAEGVGQAGVRIGADERIRRLGDLRQVLAHRARAKRAIEADGKGTRVAHRMPERGRRLAGQGAARAVGDGARDHQRHGCAALSESLEAGEDRGLGVERVEYGLDEENLRAAVDQPPDLLAIGDAKLVEADRAEARIVDVGRQRGSAVGRSESARDETAPSVGLFGLDRRPARQSRPVAVKFVDQILHSVVGLSDRGRGEGVGLENVGARQRVGQMDVFDRLRLGQG